MGRIMAIDYGRKRTGLAVTDTLKLIASGLTTVDTHKLIPYLVNYIKQEEVELFVVGMPKQMNNEPSENLKYVEQFTVQLTKSIPNIAFEYYDERFTSRLAMRAMIDGGLKKSQRQNKALVDKVSATIILQSYLESKKTVLHSNA